MSTTVFLPCLSTHFVINSAYALVITSFRPSFFSGDCYLTTSGLLCQQLIASISFQYFVLNCKSKIHPIFVSGGFYLCKFMKTDRVEFTFANNPRLLILITTLRDVEGGRFLPVHRRRSRRPFTSITHISLCPGLSCDRPAAFRRGQGLG